MLPTIVPAENLSLLQQLVRHAIKLHGDYWECGVYNGGTASIIHSLIPEDRNLVLFDSFEGLPPETQYDNFHKKGDFNDVDYERVKDYFSNNNNVKIVKGFIPETFKNFTESKICFVHIDLDLYEGYKKTLEFVWPRLVPGGVIALDDYKTATCLGARKATDEFAEKFNIQILGNYYLVKPINPSDYKRFFREDQK